MGCGCAQKPSCGPTFHFSCGRPAITGGTRYAAPWMISLRLPDTSGLFTSNSLLVVSATIGRAHEVARTQVPVQRVTCAGPTASMFRPTDRHGKKTPMQVGMRPGSFLPARIRCVHRRVNIAGSLALERLPSSLNDSYGRRQAVRGGPPGNARFRRKTLARPVRACALGKGIPVPPIFTICPSFVTCPSGQLTCRKTPLHLEERPAGRWRYEQGDKYCFIFRKWPR